MTHKSQSSSRELGLGTLAMVILVACSSLHFVAGIVATLLIPLPVLYLRWKAGRWRAALIGISVWFLYGFVTMGSISLPVLMVLATPTLLGILLGEFLLAGYPVGRCIAFSTIGCLIALFAVMSTWSTGADGVPFFESFRAQLQVNMEAAFEAYGSVGLIPAEQIPEYKEMAKVLTESIFRIFPALFVIGFAVMAWITLVIARKIDPMKGLFSKAWEHLKEWQAPDPLIWVLVSAGCLLLLSGPVPKAIGMNVLLVVLLVYFFQGLSIVAFFFDRKQIPKFIRGIGYAFILFQEVATLLVIGLGVFDVWFNIRRIGKNAMDPLNENG
ncbi:MAG: DUF2232 domain-containing protein [Deltaproteobacteria bacterium]|nr:DUF2232 domain-containing protein [Deltaproteobacteria bacterium]